MNFFYFLYHGEVEPYRQWLIDILKERKKDGAFMTYWQT